MNTLYYYYNKYTKEQINMVKRKKSKDERKRDREIVELYHKKVTEDALETLFQNFMAWKKGELPYYELTERIHEFHKQNQKIWSTFNYYGWNDETLIFRAKRDLNLLTEEEKECYKIWLDDFE